VPKECEGKSGQQRGNGKNTLRIFREIQFFTGNPSKGLKTQAEKNGEKLQSGLGEKMSAQVGEEGGHTCSGG